MRVALKEQRVGVEAWLGQNSTIEILTYGGTEVELVPELSFVCNSVSLHKLVAQLTRLVQSQLACFCCTPRQRRLHEVGASAV